MNSDLLTSATFTVTVVSSVVAIAAVSICSILSAVVTQRGVRKTKHAELVFRDMVTAYYDYLHASGNYSDVDNREEVRLYTESFTRAYLFASSGTRKLLQNHKKCVANALLAMKNNSPDKDELVDAYSKAKDNLVQSMQDDLYSRGFFKRLLSRIQVRCKSKQ